MNFLHKYIFLLKNSVNLIKYIISVERADSYIAVNIKCIIIFFSKYIIGTLFFN
jgi:hypothetical protein